MRLHSLGIRFAMCLLPSLLAAAERWPVDLADTQVLFGRFDATDSVRLPGSNEEYQTYLPMRGRVWRTPDQRLDCAGGAWRCSQEGVDAFARHSAASGRFILGLRYESLGLQGPESEGVIFSYGAEGQPAHCELIQRAGKLHLRLRSGTGALTTHGLGAVGSGAAYLHLAYDAAASPRLRAWRDGQPLPLDDTQAATALTSSWSNGLVHLGNDAALARPWHGRLDALTLGSGTCDDQRALAQYRALAERFPAPAAAPASVVVRARLLGGAEDGEEEARQYTRSIYTYTFAVEAVLSGTLDAQRISVRRLARMDRAMDPTVVGLQPGTIQTLVLLPWSEMAPAFEAETIYTLEGDDSLPGFFEASRR